MPKGKYVFEYDVVANASGKFSNGITTMQNYYAPQMNAHTKGSNVNFRIIDKRLKFYCSFLLKNFK
jgi:hypothetical protein